MKIRKPLLPVKLFIPIGLLLTCGTSLINKFIMPLPDFIIGALMGMGIGLMIVGLIKLKRANASA